MNRTACGIQRFACRYIIRSILDSHGVSMAELGRRIGVTSESVSATVLGKRHSPKVLDALKEMGVPAAYLFDPRTIGKKPA